MAKTDDQLKRLSPTLEILRSLPSPTISHDWPDYAELDDRKETISHLVALLRLDAERELMESDEWLPVHAWRILAQRQAVEAIPNLVKSLLSADPDDDWTLDELPRAIAKYGAVAIPSLRSALLEEHLHREEVWNHVGIVAALEEIGENLPSETRNVCDILREKLKDSELISPTLNAFIVSALVDLKDVDSVPHIESAYSKGVVNVEVVDWDYVVEKLGTITPLPESIVPVTYPHTNFSYSGDERFQRLLKSVGSAFNIEELKCFLLGSILAIELVPPSQILTEILVDLCSEEVEFETEGQGTYFMRELFGLWNELSNYQDTLYPLRAADSNTDDDLEGIEECAKWSVRSFRLRIQIDQFLYGLELGRTTADRLAGSKAAAFISFLKEKLGALDALDKSKDTEGYAERVQTHMEEVRSHWVEQYLPFAATCNEERRRLNERREFAKANGKIGRNEPCPCGSGKKFKKCCLN